MVRVFVGPNSYGLKQALKSTKDKFTEEYGDFALEVIDGEEADFAQITGAVESVPFLSENKLVIVYDLSAVKDISEKIEELINTSEKANELLIVEPKPDKRSSYYKYLKKNVELKEFGEPDERELANWLASEAKSRGSQLSFSDAHYLVQRVGINQESLANELSKLIDYGGVISKDTIDRMCEASPQTNIFNLLDAAFSGNIGKALGIYDEQRVQGEEPLKIFGLIIWQMHLVALVESAGSKSDAEIMQASGLKPFTLNKSRSIARRMGREQIKNTLSKMVELDKRLKTTSVDPDEALKSLLLSIS